MKDTVKFTNDYEIYNMWWIKGKNPHTTANKLLWNVIYFQLTFTHTTKPKGFLGELTQTFLHETHKKMLLKNLSFIAVHQELYKNTCHQDNGKQNLNLNKSPQCLNNTKVKFRTRSRHQGIILKMFCCVSSASENLREGRRGKAEGAFLSAIFPEH